MKNILDKVFGDKEFDELTKNIIPSKKENNDPDVDKFLEIVNFIKKNGREPQKTDCWSEERKLWARLQGYRNDESRATHVSPYDELGLLNKTTPLDNEFLGEKSNSVDNININSILQSSDIVNNDYSGLLDLSRYKKTVKYVDHVSRRQSMGNFKKYKNMFNGVYADIAAGRREIKNFSNYDIKENRFYIQNGVMLYVVSISNNSFKYVNGKSNAKMHVVYENGTENKNLLYQSLASSLYSKDRNGKIVTDVVDTDLLKKNFSNDITTGFIYVLKSESSNYNIRRIKNLYKIGFTRGNIEDRIKNAQNDVTYLKAPVRIVLTAKIQNVSAQLIERTLHHEFNNFLVEFQSNDFKKATEWFIVPLDSIENKINKIITYLKNAT